MDNDKILDYARSRSKEHNVAYSAGKINPNKLIELVGKKNAGFDLINSEFANSIDCAKGCSHCCYLPVDVMAFEVIAIYEYMKANMDCATQTAILNRINTRFNEISSLSINEEKSSSRRCPLLNEHDKCSVYPVRPSNCAGMVSLDSKLCEEWKNTSSDDIEFETPGKIGTWRAIELKALEHVAADHGDTIEQYSLARALHAVINRPSLVKRWKKSRNTNLGPTV